MMEQVRGSVTNSYSDFKCSRKYILGRLSKIAEYDIVNLYHKQECIGLSITPSLIR